MAAYVREHSRIGEKIRRRALDGRMLHACCVCRVVAPWSEGWSSFCSMREIDEGLPIAKFCSEACAESAGPKCERITEKMKEEARDLEYISAVPLSTDRPPTRTYDDAVREQREDRP